MIGDGEWLQHHLRLVELVLALDRHLLRLSMRRLRVCATLRVRVAQVSGVCSRWRPIHQVLCRRALLNELLDRLVLGVIDTLDELLAEFTARHDPRVRRLHD